MAISQNEKGEIEMLKTVNGGIETSINGLDVEILSHHFHNPYCNIVCTYYMDGGHKVELTYYKDINTGEDGHEVYMFKEASDVQQYRSYNYTKKRLPGKYQTLAEKLIEIHNQIDFEEYTTRPNEGGK